MLCPAKAGDRAAKNRTRQAAAKKRLGGNKDQVAPCFWGNALAAVPAAHPSLAPHPRPSLASGGREIFSPRSWGRREPYWRTLLSPRSGGSRRGESGASRHSYSTIRQPTIAHPARNARGCAASLTRPTEQLLAPPRQSPLLLLIIISPFFCVCLSGHHRHTRPKAVG